MLRLVPAVEADVQFVNDLIRVTMKDYVEATWRDEARRESYYTGNGFRLENTRIVYRKDKRVGRLSLKERDGGIFLDNMHIIPEAQSRGIGSWVVREVIREAKEQDKILRVSVLKTNPAVKLYRRLGFSVYGEARQRWLLEYHEASSTS